MSEMVLGTVRSELLTQLIVYIVVCLNHISDECGNSMSF